MKRKAIILGAGITGLTTAWRLSNAGFDVCIIEKEKEAGGQARTIQHKDFLLDLGAHKIFTVLDHVQRIMEDLLGEGLLKREKHGKIYYDGVYLPFPIGMRDMLRSMSFPKLTYLSTSFALSKFTGIFTNKKIENYEDWFIANYGRAIYNRFVKEATEKIWGVASSLSADLANRRVTSPTFFEILKQCFLGQKINRVTSAEYFYYPKLGCQMFVDKLLDKTLASGGRLLTNTSVEEIRLSDQRVTSVTLNNGSTLELDSQDVLISTIPKKDLFRTFSLSLPGEVAYSLTMLRERNLLLTYIFLDQKQMNEANWIFFPRRSLFARLFEQKNCSPFMCPPDKTVICAESTCHADQVFSPNARQYVADRIVDSLHGIGLLDRRKVTESCSFFLEHAYPLWEVGYKARVSTLLDFLDQFTNLFSVGRQGGFVYGGIADCMDVGLVTSQFVTEGRPKTEWAKERARFDDYVVID